MTKNLDIQLNTYGAVLTAEDVPGVGELTLDLDMSQLVKLYDLMREAYLAGAFASEEKVIESSDLRAGDILDWSKLMVKETELQEVSGIKYCYIAFDGTDEQLILKADRTVRVWRKVS